MTPSSDGQQAVVLPWAVDRALREVIAHLDYDLHKQIECDEGTGEDTYHEQVAMFVDAYAQACAKGEES